MRLRRGIGLAMVLVECAALGYGLDTFVMPVALATVAIAIAAIPRRLKVTRDRFYIVAIAIAGISVVIGQFYPAGRINSMSFVLGNSTALYGLALMAIGYQLLQLAAVVVHAHHDEAGPFASFPFHGVVALSVSAMFTFGTTGRMVFTVIAGGFVLLTAAYLLASNGSLQWSRYRSGTRGFLAAFVLLVIGLGGLSAVGLRQSEQQINAFLGRLAAGAGAGGGGMGFSRTGSLGSVNAVKTSGDDAPVLFVRAEQSPGYLRGLAFETYADGRWKAPSKAAETYPGMEPAVLEIDPAERRSFFRVRPLHRPSGLEAYEVLSTPPLRDVVFLTPETVGVRLSTDWLLVDGHGSIRETHPPRGSEYRVYDSVDTVEEQLTEEERRVWTSVPESLDPEVAALADSIFGDHEGAVNRALAVQDYFRENYVYELGVQVPRGSEPLTYFLLEQPPAHCEYFASGAAILLRLGGIPCRYVTGFVVAEHNALGGHYVSRNKDAHAWVEAWDLERGWFIVEATPSSGVPQARNAGFYDRWRDSVAYAWARLRAGAGLEPLRAGAEFIRSILAIALNSWAVRILFGILIVRWLARTVRFRRRRAGNMPHMPAEVLALHALLKRADGLARADGHVRGASETLSAFAERVSESRVALASWYRSYEALRYGPRQSESSIRALEDALPK